MEAIHLQPQYDDRYSVLPSNVRNEHRALSGLPAAFRQPVAWRTSDSPYTTPSSSATVQSPLRYEYSHGSLEQGYDASAEPSPTSHPPPAPLYERPAAMQDTREDSPNRMSAREEPPRPRNTAPFVDDGYPVSTHNVSCFRCAPHTQHALPLVDARHVLGRTKRISQPTPSFPLPSPVTFAP